MKRDDDICVEKTNWATISNVEDDKVVETTFDKPTIEIVEHLRPFYMNAQLNGKTLTRVFTN
ncbi:hypothetical protein JHK85_053536 [Glycine max]|nr:hypothetical protein JHK85_053536 [Glycine max]